MNIPFTFEIDEDVKDKFEKRAAEDFRSMAAQIRFLIERYLEEK